nr:branchpoint-bridging protein-like [Aegilops tauschii subsp. strangulata]
MEVSGSGDPGDAPPPPAGAAAGVSSPPGSSSDPRPASPPPASPASSPLPSSLEVLPRIRWADLAEEDEPPWPTALAPPVPPAPPPPRSCVADQRGRWLSLPLRRFCLRLAAARAEPANELCSSASGPRRSLAGLGRPPTLLLGSGGPV